MDHEQFHNNSQTIVLHGSEPVQISSSPENSSLHSSAIASFDLYTAYTFACALLMLILCVGGAFGNLLSVLIFTRRSMRSSINVLLTGLSFVDLLVLASAFVVYVIPGLNAFNHFGPMPNLELIMYLGVYQISMILQTASVYMFVLISLERYFAVCKPFHAQRILTVKRARLAQTGVGAFATAYNLCRFWEFAADSSTAGGYRRLLREDDSYFIGYYTIAYVAVHFFCPFFLITVLNALIVRSIAKASTLRRALAPTKSMRHGGHYHHRRNSTLTNGNGTTSGDASAVAAIKDAKKQSSITRMIVVVTLIFVITNAPPFILNLYECLDPNLFAGANMQAAYAILDTSNLMVILNSSTNCLIYAVYCRQYRRLCRRYFRRVCAIGGWSRKDKSFYESCSEVSRVVTTLPDAITSKSALDGSSRVPAGGCSAETSRWSGAADGLSRQKSRRSGAEPNRSPLSTRVSIGR